MTPALEQIKALPEVQRTAPEFIYLTVSDNPHDAEKPFPADYGDELCWCQDEAVSVCVPYVRADLAALRDEAGEAVEQRVPPQLGGGKTKLLALCPASCGCLWVNNGDGTMSLFSINSKSCDECENLPWAGLLPVHFGHTRPAPAAEAAPQGGVECAASPDGKHSEHDEPGTAGWCEWCSREIAATPPSAPAVDDVVSALVDLAAKVREERASYTLTHFDNDARTLIRRLSAPVPQEGVDWQKRCLEHGFKYWRAPDAHGVECTHEQALDLLRDLLGVEVDFVEPAALIRRMSAPVPQVGVDEAVNRFLGWPLPKDFAPDCGINFDGRHDDEWNKGKTWPTGTNLFTAEQAKAMFEHCLAAGALPQVDASWLADVRRCLEDVSTEMRSRGRGDERFQRLIQRMPRLAAAPAQGVR